MSLNRILEALEAEAGQQVAEIERSTQAEIDRIRAQAQAEAEAVQQKHMAANQASLQVERTRRLNRARQAASQIILNARESLMASTLACAAEHLAAFSAAEAYPGLLHQLTREVIGPLGPNRQLCLHVREGDVALMQPIVRGLGLTARVMGDLDGVSDSGRESDCLGGLVVTTADERIRLTNTLQARLDRVAKLQRAQIAEIIFDHRQQEG
jgi:V/A-type H+-transporting ATPase subunit E